MLTTSSPSRVDLQVFGYGTPGEVQLEGRCTSTVPYRNERLATVSFVQGNLIGVADVTIPFPQGGSDFTGGTPPTILAADAYPRMSEMDVPVTRNFHYRPTWLANGPTPKPGWDVVWIERRSDHARQKELVASVVDAWYPGHYLRAVYDYLGGDSKSLQDPPSSRLLGGRLIFTAPDAAYENLDRLILVSRLDATLRGHHFEQAEIWSERRVLLALVRIERLGNLPREDVAPGVLES